MTVIVNNVSFSLVLYINTFCKNNKTHIQLAIITKLLQNIAQIDFYVLSLTITHMVITHRDGFSLKNYFNDLGTFTYFQNF